MQQPNSESEIFSKLTGVIQQLLSNPNLPEIRPDSRLIGELGIDSLKLAELSILLEDQFKRNFFLPSILSTVADPYDLTVGSVQQFIQNVLKESS